MTPENLRQVGQIIAEMDDKQLDQMKKVVEEKYEDKIIQVKKDNNAITKEVDHYERCAKNEVKNNNF